MIVYIETNFLVGYASGRDADADRLLVHGSVDTHLVVPGVCLMEAFSLIESERRRINRLVDDLGNEERSVGLDTTSAHAPGLAIRLREARTEIGNRFNDFVRRLNAVILALSDVAEFIPISPEIIRSNAAQVVILEPTDNLILACILNHAAGHPGVRKAFLSENRKDFSQNQFAAGLLKDAGIKYFGQAAKLLEWAGTGSGA